MISKIRKQKENEHGRDQNEPYRVCKKQRRDKKGCFVGRGYVGNRA